MLIRNDFGEKEIKEVHQIYLMKAEMERIKVKLLEKRVKDLIKQQKISRILSPN